MSCTIILSTAAFVKTADLLYTPKSDITAFISFLVREEVPLSVLRIPVIT